MLVGFVYDTFTDATVSLFPLGTPEQTAIFGVTQQTLTLRRTPVRFHFVRVKSLTKFPCCVFVFIALLLPQPLPLPLLLPLLLLLLLMLLLLLLPKLLKTNGNNLYDRFRTKQTFLKVPLVMFAYTHFFN